MPIVKHVEVEDVQYVEKYVEARSRFDCYDPDRPPVQPVPPMCGFICQSQTGCVWVWTCAPKVVYTYRASVPSLFGQGSWSVQVMTEVFEGPIFGLSSP